MRTLSADLRDPPCLRRDPGGAADLGGGRRDPHRPLRRDRRRELPHPRAGWDTSSTASVEFSHHAFPVAGGFDWGSEGSRFGAPRDGHSHQGQDLAAAEGTPVVAPRAGLVEAVQYQAEGAGHYVVIDGDDEDHDYVFMHLRTGSVAVNEGDRVRTAQRIGEVGNTGRSTGPHLHFEIWVGGWFAGGQPIDPLRLLQSWAGDV